MPRATKLSIARPAVAAHVDSFNAVAGSILTAPQKAALTKLYRRAIELGVWQKTELLNVFLNDLAASKLNLKDPTRYALTYPNGITNTAQGIQADGVNQYYDTAIRPELDLSACLGDLGIDVFIDHTTASGINYSLGVSDASNNVIGIQQTAPAQYSGATNVFVNSLTTGTATPYTNLQSHILLTIQRVGGMVQIFQNGQKVHELSVGATALPGSLRSLLGFCRNANGTPFQFTSGTHKHLCVRKSLSDASVALWSQALLEYHIDAGRIGKSNVFIGDSITYGMGNTNGAYPKLVSDAGGFFKQNWGFSGERLDVFMDTAAKGPAIIPVYNPAVHNLLFQAYGTNDILGGVSASTYGTYLSSFITLATSRGWPANKIKIIARFYQKADAGAAQRLAYNNAAAPICSSAGVQLLDVYNPLKNATNTDGVNFPGADGVHYNDAGQVALTNSILSQL